MKNSYKGSIVVSFDGLKMIDAESNFGLGNLPAGFTAYREGKYCSYG